MANQDQITRRPLLTLKKKAPPESEPLELLFGRRRVVVKPVERKTRYLCVVMGKKHRGPTKIHLSLEKARREAARIVGEAGEGHCFVVHIVESAKLDGKEKRKRGGGVAVADGVDGNRSDAVA